MKNFLKIVLSAVLLAAAWLGGSGLTLLVALVPLLSVSASEDGSVRGFWRMVGWVTLLWTLWYALDVWGVWIAAPVGVPAALFFGLLYTATPFMIYHFVSKRAPKSLAYVVLVSAWIAGEHLYNISQASFPWLNLGNGFAHGYGTLLVQWYEWTGVYGGTLWVLLVNILVWEMIQAPREQLRRRLVGVAAAVLVPVAVSLTLYFTYTPSERTMAVTIVQPNIDSYTEKFTLSQREQTANLVSLACRAPQGTELIVMPETAIDESLVEGDDMGSESTESLRQVLTERYPEAEIIAGATTYRIYNTDHKPTPTARRVRGPWYDVFNTALSIDTTSHIELSHKSKLVIGVEMMPDWAILRPLYDMIIDLGGTTGQLGSDSVRQVFRVGDKAYATGICYESIYGAHFAEYVRRGAELMTVITNDGWWGTSPIHRQHFDFSRLRAIETRRSIARSANTGISGFITPRGDVYQTLGWDTRGVLSAVVPLSDELTFYTRHGDLLARLSRLLLALSALYFVAYTYRRKDLLVDAPAPQTKNKSKKKRSK
ncbi:MAG: apolipoprotein N-acyltransferase [Rikenellaceae bacterium]|nr:apolipoprotein N-acyltransferase [Rikenellaceae bacterium]